MSPPDRKSILTAIGAIFLVTIGVFAFRAWRHRVIENARIADLRRRDEWISDTIQQLETGHTSVHLYSCVNTNVLLERLAGMPQVQELTFEQTTDLSTDGLKTLPSFPNLRELEFRGEGAVDDSNIHLISECLNVQSLSLKATNVSDDGLQHVAKLTKLKRFRHMGEFSETALQSLQKKLPNCTIAEVGWYD